MRDRFGWLIAALPVLMLLAVPALVPAKGGGGKGKVYISPKACPTSVYKKNSGNALVSWFKSHRKFEVWEKDPEEVEKTCAARCADEESEEKTKKCHDACKTPSAKPSACGCPTTSSRKCCSTPSANP